MGKLVVLSGIRATGRLHLGNYLGALVRFAKMSKDPQYHCLFFVADMHTLTTLRDAAQIRENMPEIILDYLAAGVDPEKATIYLQSSIPQVAELAWYLGCLISEPQLRSLPTFKDKAKKIEQKGEIVTAGLFSYPILMAADILGPRAHYVPVGADQLPHLELTQQIARNFNRLFGDYFPVPDAMKQDMIKVTGLSLNKDMDDDGRDLGGFEKMGKSDGNSIILSDTAEQTWEKIRVAPTDPARKRREDPGDPEKCPIYALHEFVSSGEHLAHCRAGCTSASIGCLDCKAILSQNINGQLAEFRERRLELAGKTSLVRDVLAEGKRRAEPFFDETLKHVREKIGLTGWKEQT